MKSEYIIQKHPTMKWTISQSGKGIITEVKYTNFNKKLKNSILKSSLAQISLDDL